MGGFEYAAAQSARASILEQARAIIAQESAAEAEGAKKETAPADPCTCRQCGKLVKPEHAFVIRRVLSFIMHGSVGAIGSYAEHKNCDAPDAPPIDGLSIMFAPQGF